MRPWRVRLPIRMLPSSPCADRLEGPVLPQGGLPQREADADRDLEEVPSSEEPRRASQWFRPDRVARRRRRGCPPPPRSRLLLRSRHRANRGTWGSLPRRRGASELLSRALACARLALIVDAGVSASARRRGQTSGGAAVSRRRAASGGEAASLAQIIDKLHLLQMNCSLADESFFGHLSCRIFCCRRVAATCHRRCAMQLCAAVGVPSHVGGAAKILRRPRRLG